MIYSSISISLMAILEKLRIGDPNRIASLTVFFNNLGSFCNFFVYSLSKNVSGSFQFGLASFKMVCYQSSTEFIIFFYYYFSSIFCITSQFGFVRMLLIFLSEISLFILGFWVEPAINPPS